MGASPFIVEAYGTTTQSAFQDAVDSALHEYGHGGYTGSIAEKDSFITIPLPDKVKPYAEANHMIEADDQRICSKWGPAGSFELRPGHYLFFGWASS